MKKTLTLFIAIGQYLLGHAQQNDLRLVLPIGHTETVTIVAFSADSRLLLTASNDQTAKLWQVPTGIMLADLKCKGWFRAIGFVPGGNYIFTSNDSIRIWKTSDAKLHLTLPGKFPKYAELCFTPDGNRAISHVYDSIYLWNITTGEKLSSIYYKDINSASFSPDGFRFIAAGRDGRVSIYTTEKQSHVLSFKASERGINDAQFSPDGKWILTTDYAKNIKLWNTEGKLQYDLASFKDFLPSAVFTNDSKYVIGVVPITWWGDKTAKIWRISDGVLVADIKGRFNRFSISGNNFNREGKNLVLPSQESGETYIYSFPEMSTVTALKHSSSYILDAKYSPDGRHIATASEDNTAKIYNAMDGTLLVDLVSKTSGNIREVIFSSDRKYMVTNPNGPAFLWNTLDGTLANAFHTMDETLKVVRFSADNQYILTISDKSEVRLWNAKTQEILVNNLKKDLPHRYVNYQGTFEFTSDSKKVFIANHDRQAYLFETATGKVLATISNDENIEDAAINSTGGYVATVGFNNTLKIWDATNGNLKNQLQLKEKFVDYNNEVSHLPPQSILFSNSGNQVIALYSYKIKLYKLNGKKPYKTIAGSDYIALTANNSKVLVVDDQTFKLWNIETSRWEFNWKDIELDIYNHTGSFTCLLHENYLVYKCRYSIKVVDINTKKQVAEFKTFDGYPSSVSFNTEKTRLAVAYSNGITRIWSVNNSLLVKEMRGLNADVRNIYFMRGDNDKKILTVSDDNISKIWDANTGDEYYSFFALNSRDYFLQNPEGYYMCTPAASRLLYYISPKLEAITFAQLDVKFNRPDKLLQASCSTNTPLINSYYKAWQKRVQKLGVDTTRFEEGFSVPESDFKNRSQIEYEQKDYQLSLQVWGKDKDFKLDRYNVWVNEVAVFGQKGINIRDKNLNELNTNVTIALSEGRNKIETSVLDVNGIESYRIPLYVNYATPTLTPVKIHFIGIGVDRFLQPGHDLQYAVKDIRDLTTALRLKYGDKLIVDTLFNENVSKDNILAIKERLLQTNVNDKVILSFSGHGLLSKDFDYFLATHDVDFSQPEKGGLPYEDLEWLMDGIPARKKLMLIDACHSGEVDKEELLAINNSDKPEGVKGVLRVSYKKPELGLKNSFELMQELFANINRGTGTTVISAAAGNQFAYEKSQIANGVFTFSILEMMEKRESIKVSELKEHVGKRVEELTNGQQRPTSRSETLEFDWEVW
jgi:WD40 repeat protein